MLSFIRRVFLLFLIAAFLFPFARILPVSSLSLDEEIAQISKQIADLEKSIAPLKNESTSLQSQIASAKVQIARTEKQIADLGQKLIDKEADLDGAFPFSGGKDVF